MDVRGEIYDPENFQYSGEISKPDNIQSDSGRGSLYDLRLETTAFGRAIKSSTIGEFDPGSGRTLAACLTHASQGGPAMGNRRTGA